MGGIFQFLEFNQSSTSRKLSAHKRHNEGFEAPRNSLEFPMEASQSYHVIQDDIPYSCQVKQQSSKMNIYPNGTPVKRLIDEEMSNKTYTTKNSPSVVARLMGMDSFPSNVNRMAHAAKDLNDKTRINITKRELKESSVILHQTSHSSSAAVKQSTQEMLPYSSKSSKSKKPQAREHPQEELLQKFKKEFEAWQASKVWEHSRSLEIDRNHQWDKENQILAQECLNRERLGRYVDAKAHENLKEPMLYTSSAPKLMINTRQGGGLRHEEYGSKQFYSNLRVDMESRIGEKTNNFEHLPVAKFCDKEDKPSSPTRIVILKPSSEEIEQSQSGSSEILDREGSMKDFLEEVRERLRSEIHGKARENALTRVRAAETTETSFSDSSTDPRQIARDIAKQIRESVTRDLGTMLIRSESTRSYRSETQFNGLDSPEFMHRDTRRLLSERLKNVLKNDSNVDIPLMNNGRSATNYIMKNKVKLKPMPDFSKTGRKKSYWEERKLMAESKARSFRRGQENAIAVDSGAVSPRNLVRSFSAPVSGTAFGKLLLEDQHVPTGAHIRRKHEVSGHNSPVTRTNGKDVFNLKGKVSNLRHNFNLKGKLFGKKIQSADKPASNGFDPMKVLTTAPSIVMNLRIAQDNSTEVPPSPASVSDGSYDELCRPGHPSPVSPLEVPFTDDHQSTQDSGEFSSNLPEVRNVPEQAENSVTDEVVTEGIAIELHSCENETAELEDTMQAYIRDILVAAGLYGGEAFDQVFPKWDALTKPISKWVFEEVEEACSRERTVEDNYAESLLNYNDTFGGRKLLFDLINEALPRVIRTPMASSTFKNWVLGPKTLPHGKKLLDDLWHQMQIHANPLVDEAHSLDSMVAWDLRMTSWSKVSHEDIGFMGTEMEVVILGDLIDEFVSDMCS